MGLPGLPDVDGLLLSCLHWDQDFLEARSDERHWGSQHSRIHVVFIGSSERFKEIWEELKLPEVDYFCSKRSRILNFNHQSNKRWYIYLALTKRNSWKFESHELCLGSLLLGSTLPKKRLIFLTRRPLSRLGRPTGIWKTGSLLSAPGAGVY